MAMSAKTVPLDVEAAVARPASPRPKDWFKTTASVVLYMLCSACMLVVNKAALRAFPVPTTLLLLQLVTSAGAMWTLGQAGVLPVEGLEWNRVKAYLWVVVSFICNIFFNMKALQVSNIETVIVFRTLGSLAVAMGEWLLLKQGPPSQSTLNSLFLIAGGALGYMFTDSEFRLDTYMWVVGYLFVNVAEVLYVKHILNSLKMNTWSCVYYSNLLATVPTVGLMLLYDEWNQTQALLNGALPLLSPFNTFAVVSLSCLIGLGISVMGFTVRSQVSATSFNVLGNVNKILTELINVTIWAHHASPPGIASLFVCILGGYMYSVSKQ